MNTHQNHIPETAILDTQDKPVTFTGPDAIQAAQATIKALDEVMDFPMEAQCCDDAVCLIPDKRFTITKPLTIPERAIVAAFAAHFTKYAHGLKRDADIRLPKAVTSPSNDVYDEVADVCFRSEARAYMFAEVAGHVFGLDAEVIETPKGNGWLVAVSSPDGIDGDVFEQLRGACWITENYRLERLEDGEDAAEGTGCLPSHKSAQRAILSRLDAILERLDPAMPLKQPVAINQEAKISKGKSKKTA